MWRRDSPLYSVPVPPLKQPRFLPPEWFVTSISDWMSGVRILSSFVRIWSTARAMGLSVRKKLSEGGLMRYIVSPEQPRFLPRGWFVTAGTICTNDDVLACACACMTVRIVLCPPPPPPLPRQTVLYMCCLSPCAQPCSPVVMTHHGLHRVCLCAAWPGADSNACLRVRTCGGSACSGGRCAVSCATSSAAAPGLLCWRTRIAIARASSALAAAHGQNRSCRSTQSCIAAAALARPRWSQLHDARAMSLLESSLQH